MKSTVNYLKIIADMKLKYDDFSDKNYKPSRVFSFFKFEINQMINDNYSKTEIVKILNSSLKCNINLTSFSSLLLRNKHKNSIVTVEKKENNYKSLNNKKDQNIDEIEKLMLSIKNPKIQ